MELSTSTALYGPSPSHQQSDSSNEDSIRSFKLFLDLITPAEFLKLLRARVRHLLNTWLPQRETNTSSSSSSTSLHSEPPSPTLESVQAFTSFFRSQDAPGPSPIELPSSTSLPAIQHHLVALQTLLSFLSGRELKDIVCARLNEGGKAKLVTVQGLMDIMRNPGREEGEANEWPPSGAVVQDESIPSNQPLAVEGAGARAVTPGHALYTLKRSQRNEHVGWQDEARSNSCGDGQPPKKRQRIEASDRGPGDGGDSSSPALERSSTPQPLSHLQEQSSTQSSTVFNHLCLPPRTPSNPSNPAGHAYITDAMDCSFTSRLSAGSDGRPHPELSYDRVPGSQPDPDSERVKPVDALRADMEITTQSAAGSKANLDDSDREDEGGGLIVTLVDEGKAATMSGVSHPPDTPSVTVQGSPLHEPVLTTVGIAPVTTATLKAEQEQVPLAFPSFTGMSRAESNRRRMRAALGLPPKEPENSGVSSLSMNTGHEIAKGVVGEQPQGLRHILNSVPAPTMIPANSSPPGSPFTSRPCAAERQVSLPHSPAFDDYNSDEDRASPPGPVLRAVDWASGVAAVPEGTAMDVDELEAEDASDDTLAFNPSLDADGVLKPSAAYPRNTFLERHGQVTAWPHDGDSTAELTNDGNEATETAEQSQKLFIRLPARQRAGASSTGTEASVSPPPLPPASPSRVDTTCETREIAANEHGHTDPAYATEPIAMSTPDRMDSQSQHPPRTGETPTPTQTEDQSPTDAEPSLPNKSPTNTELPHPAPSAPAPSPPAPSSEPQSQTSPQPQSQPEFQSHMQLQPLPISRTQSASPGTLQHSTHALHPMPTGAYPGPWFGAMFYVPLRGPPQYPAHHAPAMLPRPPPAPPKPITGAVAGPSNPQAVVAGRDQAEAGSSAFAAESGSSSKGATNRSGSAELDENDVPPPVEMDPNVRYTDDVSVKEGPGVKRRCFNCSGVQAPSWRKSKLTMGKILCNKCGIYESTHMTARPLKTRPRRSLGESQSKKRKSTKKTVQ